MLPYSLIIIIIINHKNWRSPESDFRHETEARKVMVDFIDSLVSLHRESLEVSLVEKLSGTLYWWVEICVPSQHYYYYIDDEEIAIISNICWAAEMDFHCLAECRHEI